MQEGFTVNRCLVDPELLLTANKSPLWSGVRQRASCDCMDVLRDIAVPSGLRIAS